MCFNFLCNFVWKVFLSKKNSAGCYHKCTTVCMQSISNSCQILMKIEFPRPIFKNDSNKKNYENPSIWGRVGQCKRTDRRRDRQTDRQTIIHSAVCLTTGPKPLPKRAPHIMRSRASSFKWQYPLLSLKSSSSFPRLLPRLPVTSIPKASSPHNAI